MKNLITLVCLMAATAVNASFYLFESTSSGKLLGVSQVDIWTGNTNYKIVEKVETSTRTFQDRCLDGYDVSQYALSGSTINLTVPVKVEQVNNEVRTFDGK